MSDITEALREEHQALLPQIDELRAVADRLDEMPQHTFGTIWTAFINFSPSI